MRLGLTREIIKTYIYFILLYPELNSGSSMLRIPLVKFEIYGTFYICTWSIVPITYVHCRNLIKYVLTFLVTTMQIAYGAAGLIFDAPQNRSTFASQDLSSRALSADISDFRVLFKALFEPTSSFIRDSAGSPSIVLPNTFGTSIVR
jgi:hypothetical protein